MYEARSEGVTERALLFVRAFINHFVRKFTDGKDKNMVKAEIKANKLILTLDLQDPTPSASGKTLVVATTHGNVQTSVTVNDKPITVGVNAYIRK